MVSMAKTTLASPCPRCGTTIVVSSDAPITTDGDLDIVLDELKLARREVLRLEHECPVDEAAHAAPVH
jgi:hypothetical protein